MTTLRNLARRKLRTTLTILGMTIGIWALVVWHLWTALKGVGLEDGALVHDSTEPSQPSERP